MKGNDVVDCPVKGCTGKVALQTLEVVADIEGKSTKVGTADVGVCPACSAPYSVSRYDQKMVDNLQKLIEGGSRFNLSAKGYDSKDKT